ncbi:MAG TPA: hypothetical protein VHR66_18705 [Gemmataceae bacterium]|jgi:hypothetical protein|nr:hypothetical protein [Gemmataceae bacterium]
MTSPADGVERAIQLAEKTEPTPEEAAFLERFFADHLRPQPGEDPAAHAARLNTPELFKLYRQLRTDINFALPEARQIASAAVPTEHHEYVASRVLAERTPAATSHADFVDVDEDYTSAAHVEVVRESEPSAPSPPIPSGNRKPPQAEAKPSVKRRGIRQRISDFVHRYRLAARLLLAAVTIAGLSYGMMWVINRQAHRSAEPVRRMQQQTGKAAEEIGADPSRAPIDNKVRSTSSATATATSGR